MSDAVDEVLSAFGSGATDAASAAGGTGNVAADIGAGASDAGAAAGGVADTAASAAGGTGNVAADIGAGAADAGAGAGSDAAALLGATTSGSDTASAAIGGATGASPGAAAALNAAPAAGSAAPVIGGGTAPAGNIPDIGASQVASQVSQPGAAASGATGATDVGSLSPGTSGGTPFGSDVAPQAAVEGKPDVPDEGGSNFFGKGGTLNAVLNDPGARLGIAALPAAAALIKGQPAVPQGISNLQPGGAVTAPLIGAETSQLTAANSGQLTAPQAAQVAQFTQQAQSQLYQQLAASGVADPTKDSRYVAGMAQIQQQAQAMTQNFIQQEFTTGFSAAGQAASALTTAANAEVQQDQSFQGALNSALQSFGLIEGLGSRAAA